MELHRSRLGAETRKEHEDEERDVQDRSAHDDRAHAPHLGAVSEGEETEKEEREPQVLTTGEDAEGSDEEGLGRAPIEGLEGVGGGEHGEGPRVPLVGRDVADVRVEEPGRRADEGTPRTETSLGHLREGDRGARDGGRLNREEERDDRSVDQARDPEREDHDRDVETEHVGAHDRIPEAAPIGPPGHSAVEGEVEGLVVESRKARVREREERNPHQAEGGDEDELRTALHRRGGYTAI